MLCACRNENLWLKLIILALAGVLALASLSAGKPAVVPPVIEQQLDPTGRSAIESNAILVQKELARGALVVALGTEMDQMEHRGLVEALKAPNCEAAEDPAREELMVLRTSLRAELRRHHPVEVARIDEAITNQKLLEGLQQAAQTGTPTRFNVEEFTVEVGFVTYSYWQVMVMPPTGTQLLPKESERMRILPATKQAYLKLSPRQVNLFEM